MINKRKKAAAPPGCCGQKKLNIFVGESAALTNLLF